MQVYCPLCEDCYCPRSKYHDNIDGAFFGTTFPHLLLMTYPQLQPEAAADPYVPRVFGFKLSSSAPGRSQGGLTANSRKQSVSSWTFFTELQHRQNLDLVKDVFSFKLHLCICHMAPD